MASSARTVGAARQCAAGSRDLASLRQRGGSAGEHVRPREEGEEDGEKWEETYQGLVKLIGKETERQSFW